VTPEARIAEELLLQHALTNESKPPKAGVQQPILYSFCSKINDQLDPTILAQASGRTFPLASTPAPVAPASAKEIDEAAEREYARLGEYMRDELRGSGLGDVRFALDNKTSASGDRYVPNIFLYSQWTVSFVKDPGSLLQVYEHAGTGEPRETLSGLVLDQASTVTLKSRPATDGRSFCTAIPRGCATLFAKQLAVYVEHIDDNDKVVRAKVELDTLAPAEWVVNYDFRARLKSSVDIVIVALMANKEVEIKRIKGVRVENLGLVLSFPVISEIVGQIQKHPKLVKDIELQSSIPTSIAVDLKGGSPMPAVTFPWMIGFNPRGVPRLADTIRVFPHLSLLFPLDAAPRPATGVGVQVANAFSFSAAFPLSGSSTTYLMLGVSIPDLAKMLDLSATAE
jgi:hypothetical protein